MYPSPHSGNRCHQQSKTHNAEMLEFYEQQAVFHCNRPESSSLATVEGFPNVLLLMISEEEWEDMPQWYPPIESSVAKWVSNLIEE